MFKKLANMLKKNPSDGDEPEQNKNSTQDEKEDNTSDLCQNIEEEESVESVTEKVEKAEESVESTAGISGAALDSAENDSDEETATEPEVMPQVDKGNALDTSAAMSNSLQQTNEDFGSPITTEVSLTNDTGSALNTFAAASEQSTANALEISAEKSDSLSVDMGKAPESDENSEEAGAIISPARPVTPIVPKVITTRKSKIENYNQEKLTTIQMPRQKRKISRKDIRKAMKTNNEAVESKSKGNYDEAHKGYQQAIDMYPQYAIAYYNRAILHQEQGNSDKALADMNKAIETNSKDPEFYNNRGNIYAHQEKFEKAIEDYDNAIKISPNNSDSYHNRAQIYSRIDKFSQALEDFQRAIQLNPDIVVDYYNIACIYSKQEEQEKAIEFLEKAMKKGYDNRELINNDPDLDKLRTNPAYQDLLDEWNIED